MKPDYQVAVQVSISFLEICVNLKCRTYIWPQGAVSLCERKLKVVLERTGSHQSRRPSGKLHIEDYNFEVETVTPERGSQLLLNLGEEVGEGFHGRLSSY